MVFVRARTDVGWVCVALDVESRAEVPGIRIVIVVEFPVVFKCNARGDGCGDWAVPFEVPGKAREGCGGCGRWCVI